MRRSWQEQSRVIVKMATAAENEVAVVADSSKTRWQLRVMDAFLVRTTLFAIRKLKYGSSICTLMTLSLRDYMRPEIAQI